MIESQATIATENGGRYLRQLCKHWGHKLEVEQTDDNAVVQLPGVMLTMTADPASLHIHLRAEGRESLDAMKDVVASHLVRFAFREAPFIFDWKDRHPGPGDQ